MKWHIHAKVVWGKVGTRVVPLKNCINFPFCGVLSFGGFKPISFLFASSPLPAFDHRHIAFLKAFKSSRKELECVFFAFSCRMRQIAHPTSCFNNAKECTLPQLQPALFVCLNFKNNTTCLCFYYFILAGFK